MLKSLITTITRCFDYKVAEIYDNYNSGRLITLQSYLETLDKKLEDLKSLGDEIIELITDDTALDKQMNENIECEVEIRGKLIQLQNFISEHKSNSAVDDVSTKTSSRSKDNVVKLPKIEIRKFYGDPVNWRTVYDSFTSAVDRNQNLSGVEKINYLSNLVKGEAESTIRGLTLCNQNYKICLKMLQDRYGDPQVLISAHMNKLLNLEKIRNLHNLKALRSLCDQVEAQVRSFNALGLDANNYGPMLIPVFLCKIPEELNLIISRKFGKEVWDISIILDTFKLEVEAREKIQFSSSNANVGSISESMSLLLGLYEQLAQQNDSTMEKFKAGVNFIDKRDQVKFPFCEDHDLLGDNFQVAKNRLRNLCKQFERKPDLRKRYDAIFKEQEQMNIIERVKEIRNLCGESSMVWKLVRSNDNPADIISRGASPFQLCNGNMWFVGPPFLMLEGVWPDYVYDVLNVTCLWSDTDIHDIDNNKVSNDPNLSEIISPSKYNSFLKLVRITAWVMRFINNLRRKKINKDNKLTNKRHGAEY